MGMSEEQVIQFIKGNGFDREAKKIFIGKLTSLYLGLVSDRLEEYLEGNEDVKEGVKDSGENVVRLKDLNKVGKSNSKSFIDAVNGTPDFTKDKNVSLEDDSEEGIKDIKGIEEDLKEDIKGFEEVLESEEAFDNFEDMNEEEMLAFFGVGTKGTEDLDNSQVSTQVDGNLFEGIEENSEIEYIEDEEPDEYSKETTEVYEELTEIDVEPVEVNKNIGEYNDELKGYSEEFNEEQVDEVLESYEEVIDDVEDNLEELSEEQEPIDEVSTLGTDSDEEIFEEIFEDSKIMGTLEEQGIDDGLEDLFGEFEFAEDLEDDFEKQGTKLTDNDTTQDTIDDNDINELFESFNDGKEFKDDSNEVSSHKFSDYDTPCDDIHGNFFNTDTKEKEPDEFQSECQDGTIEVPKEKYQKFDNLRDFVREYSPISESEVLNFYDMKELNKLVKQGKVYRKRGMLSV